MARPSGAPSTAASVNTPSRTHRPCDTPSPPTALLYLAAPSRTEKFCGTHGRADDHGDKKNAEARIDDIERQIEHRRVLAPEKADVIERSRQRPGKNAADQDGVRERDGALCRGGEQAINKIECDLLLVPHQEGIGPEDDPDEQDHQNF